MKKDSFFNRLPDPNLAILSDISDVFISSGNNPDNSLSAAAYESELENFKTSQVNVGTSTIGHFMENAVNVAPASYKSLSEINSIGGIGFDGIFSPYTTSFTHSQFPTFEVPSKEFINSGALLDPTSLTLNPFNPNNELSLYYAESGGTLWASSLSGTGAATAEDIAKLNDPSGWLNYHHTISFATVGTGLYDDGPEDFNFQKDFYRRSKVEVENIRSIGLRSPMVLTGWGFDIIGNPVPADGSDKTKFAANAFSDPTNWKSGPIDLRWDEYRKVWTPPLTKVHLVKTTNTYNPSCFSYEVQRSASRSQYTRDTLTRKAFSSADPIHDPESLAYSADTNNAGCFERLDFDGEEYPHYEAFIIRETKDETDSNPYYNIWTDDCHDCGHITKTCDTKHGSSSKGKKILIENPLRQSLNVGDLAFTVKTGRKEKVNTGSFSGGTGAGASANLVTDSSGNMSGVITGNGLGYNFGGFAIIDGDICTNVTLEFGDPATSTAGLSGISVSPTRGYEANTTYPLTIYPSDTTADTEELDVHWILQAEFKSQQVTTHVECNAGIMQTCTTKIQTQGFKSCEWCGEDLTLVNNFI